MYRGDGDIARLPPSGMKNVLLLSAGARLRFATRSQQAPNCSVGRTTASGPRRSERRAELPVPVTGDPDRLTGREHTVLEHHVGGAGLEVDAPGGEFCYDIRQVAILVQDRGRSASVASAVLVRDALAALDARFSNDAE